VKAHRMMPVSIFLLVLLVGAGLLSGIFLREAWRRNLLAKWVIVGAIRLKALAPVPPATRLFREHVLDPIPKSVTELEADRAREVFGWGYVLHFKVNREDLSLILNARPFRRIYNVMYGGGYLDFEYDSRSSRSMIVYPGGGEKAPAWFTPKRLFGLEGYEFHEQKYRYLYTWVVLYDAELGEAYVLAFNGDA